jgi:hypothetical protein
MDITVAWEPGSTTAPRVITDVPGTALLDKMRFVVPLEYSRLRLRGQTPIFAPWVESEHPLDGVRTTVDVVSDLSQAATLDIHVCLDDRPLALPGIILKLRGTTAHREAAPSKFFVSTNDAGIAKLALAAGFYSITVCPCRPSYAATTLALLPGEHRRVDIPIR